MANLMKTVALVLITILISTASFYIYFATRSSINEGFELLGIQNIWAQVGIVIGLVLVLVALLTMAMGKNVNVFKTIKDILKT
jgi:uncharacterized membrane protein YidH (DUF202 family)